MESGDWVHLNLPAIAEQDEDIPISEGYVWQQEEGDLLHPEREDQRALDEMKQNMGSLVFAAQYQQRPLIEAGYVYLPNEAPWLADFMQEMINFPNGKHDDQVNSVSQFLWWARTCRHRQPQYETRVTVVSAAPDLNYHLRDLWR